MQIYPYIYCYTITESSTYRVQINIHGKIFRVLNFHHEREGDIFLGQATQENVFHQNLTPQTIDITNLETWSQSTRSCACMDATVTGTNGKQQLQQNCSCCTNATMFERELLSSHRKHTLLKCADGRSEESGPLGSGRPPIGCRYRINAIFTWLFTSSPVAIFHHSNYSS